jgi:hypothetical protein
VRPEKLRILYIGVLPTQYEPLSNEDLKIKLAFSLDMVSRRTAAGFH